MATNFEDAANELELPNITGPSPAQAFNLTETEKQNLNEVAKDKEAKANHGYIARNLNYISDSAALGEAKFSDTVAWAGQKLGLSQELTGDPEYTKLDVAKKEAMRDNDTQNMSILEKVQSGLIGGAVGMLNNPVDGIPQIVVGLLSGGASVAEKVGAGAVKTIGEGVAKGFLENQIQNQLQLQLETRRYHDRAPTSQEYAQAFMTDLAFAGVHMAGNKLFSAKGSAAYDAQSQSYKSMFKNVADDTVDGSHQTMSVGDDVMPWDVPQTQAQVHKDIEDLYIHINTQEGEGVAETTLGKEFGPYNTSSPKAKTFKIIVGKNEVSYDPTISNNAYIDSVVDHYEGTDNFEYTKNQSKVIENTINNVQKALDENTEAKFDITSMNSTSVANDIMGPVAVNTKRSRKEFLFTPAMRNWNTNNNTGNEIAFSIADDIDSVLPQNRSQVQQLTHWMGNDGLTIDHVVDSNILEKKLHDGYEELEHHQLMRKFQRDEHPVDGAVKDYANRNNIDLENLTEDQSIELEKVRREAIMTLTDIKADTSERGVTLDEIEEFNNLKESVEQLEKDKKLFKEYTKLKAKVKEDSPLNSNEYKAKAKRVEKLDNDILNPDEHPVIKQSMIAERALLREEMEVTERSANADNVGNIREALNRHRDTLRSNEDILNEYYSNIIPSKSFEHIYGKGIDIKGGYNTKFRKEIKAKVDNARKGLHSKIYYGNQQETVGKKILSLIAGLVSQKVLAFGSLKETFTNRSLTALKLGRYRDDVRYNALENLRLLGNSLVGGATNVTGQIGYTAGSVLKIKEALPKVLADFKVFDVLDKMGTNVQDLSSWAYAFEPFAPKGTTRKTRDLFLANVAADTSDRFIHTVAETNGGKVSTGFKKFFRYYNEISFKNMRTSDIMRETQATFAVAKVVNEILSVPYDKLTNEYKTHLKNIGVFSKGTMGMYFGTEAKRFKNQNMITKLEDTIFTKSIKILDDSVPDVNDMDVAKFTQRLFGQFKRFSYRATGEKITRAVTVTDDNGVKRYIGAKGTGGQTMRNMAFLAQIGVVGAVTESAAEIANAYLQVRRDNKKNHIAAMIKLQQRFRLATSTSLEDKAEYIKNYDEIASIISSVADSPDAPVTALFKPYMDLKRGYTDAKNRDDIAEGWAGLISIPVGNNPMNFVRGMTQSDASKRENFFNRNQFTWGMDDDSINEYIKALRRGIDNSTPLNTLTGNDGLNPPARRRN